MHPGAFESAAGTDNVCATEVLVKPQCPHKDKKAARITEVISLGKGA